MGQREACRLPARRQFGGTDFGPGLRPAGRLQPAWLCSGSPPSAPARTPPGPRCPRSGPASHGAVPAVAADAASAQAAQAAQAVRTAPRDRRVPHPPFPGAPPRQRQRVAVPERMGAGPAGPPAQVVSGHRSFRVPAGAGPMPGAPPRAFPSVLMSPPSGQPQDRAELGSLKASLHLPMATARVRSAPLPPVPLLYPASQSPRTRQTNAGKAERGCLFPCRKPPGRRVRDAFPALQMSTR
jgi:hypothetical protein